MKLILTVSAIIIILFSGLYLYQEKFRAEWRIHQRAYLELIENNRALNVVKENASFTFNIGLKQIWLPHMNRADRCISCHVAIEDPNFNNETNPLRTHPNGYFIAHDPEKYGCTICHDGQGRAVTFRYAAADTSDVFWNKPLLRKPFLEANCYRCHVDLLDQTPVYNRGKIKFESSGCLGCHKRDGLGGVLGPELRGIGDASAHIKYPLASFDSNVLSKKNRNQNLAYIYEAIRFPMAQPEATVMFDFKFAHQDARALTVYLKSFTAHQTGTIRLLPGPVYPLQITEKGKKVFQLYCTACHGNSGRGGVRNPNYLYDYIPSLNRLSERMFLFTNEDQDAVISILLEFGDLLLAGSQPDIPGFHKVIAKYLPIKNIITNGHIVEKKKPEGETPMNMPAWGETISEKELSAVIAYLVSIY